MSSVDVLSVAPSGALAALPSHLDVLESEAIYVLREVAASFAHPVLLFSGGKDSAVVLHLAAKAFRPGAVPFPVMHIDTGHNFPEVIAFRDRAAAAANAELIVRRVQDSIDSGRITVIGKDNDRNPMQTVTLLDAIAEFGFDACIGGARRDEEKARAKERFFSFRDAFGEWDPRNQRPELWNLFNTRLAPGESMRAFPLSNWTELDIWAYIAREAIDLPSLYYAHEREIVRRGTLLVPVSDLIEHGEEEAVETVMVRFRTVGDITCTCPVESTAATPTEIIDELKTQRISERGATRMDDRTAEASMELRKRAGYF